MSALFFTNLIQGMPIHIALGRALRQKQMTMEKIVIIGASRGLGAKLSEKIAATHHVLGVARKKDRLEDVARRAGDNFTFLSADVTKDMEKIVGAVREFQPQRIFYVAAGGPHGLFARKAWKDHVWAWEVSFLAAAQLVHAVLGLDTPPHQIILCGSAVAESAGDPLGASYCSAKHALLGLHRTLRLEELIDLRLFSPGYLDTELLPKGAAIRYKGVWSPSIVADELWQWAQSKDHGGHRVCQLHPS